VGLIGTALLSPVAENLARLEVPATAPATAAAPETAPALLQAGSVGDAITAVRDAIASAFETGSELLTKGFAAAATGVKDLLGGGSPATAGTPATPGPAAPGPQPEAASTGFLTQVSDAIAKGSFSTATPTSNPLVIASEPSMSLLHRAAESRRASMGFVPESQVRDGLAAGGRWIRTLGPP
jgi:hypothetical protein